MARLTGGATGDDLTLGNLGLPMGASGNAELVMAWWKPTTLTASRCYWGYGSNGHLRVRANPNQSELEFGTDNTTDSVSRTSTAGIVINVWHALAILFTCTNTGPTLGLRGWLKPAYGDLIELSWSLTTAPVGNFVSSSAFSFNNQSSVGAVALQGYIEDGWIIQTNQFGATSPFGIAAAGTISQTEADLVRDRIVRPWSLGKPFLPLTPVSAGTLYVSHCPFDDVVAMEYPWVHGAGSSPFFKRNPVTVGGTTPNEDRSPLAVRTLSSRPGIQRARRRRS